MAEEKKKAEESSGGGGDFVVNTIFWILLFVAIIWTIQILMERFGVSLSGLPSISSIASSFFNSFQTISIFLSLLFLLGIIYFNFKLGELSHHSHGDGHGNNHGSVSHFPKIDKKPENERWKGVLVKMSSNNEADWRLAILECDIILEEMLTKMGYRGEGIAEKLKQIEPADFLTLNDAWQAHKIRNAIAHQGIGRNLSKQEAEHAISLFEKVFKEFYFI